MRPAHSFQPPAAARDERRSEYDAWAETYPATAHNPVMRAEQAVVEPVLRRLSPRRALDVGTGSGRYLDVLTSIGASVVGVDFSMGMLTKSRGSRICADARRLPIRSASVDLVNASLMVGDVDDLPAWAREMTRVLVSGGHLVYSDFHPNWTRFDWHRTFRAADGTTHEIPFEPHALDAHAEALSHAGLTLRTLRECPLVDAGDGAVRRFRRQYGDAAVLVIIHATAR